MRSTTKKQKTKQRDYSEVLADWNVPPSFGPIAHLVGRVRGRTTLDKKLSYTQAQEMRRVNGEQKLTTRELAKGNTGTANRGLRGRDEANYQRGYPSC